MWRDASPFSLSAELHGLKMLMVPLVRRTMETAVAAIDRIGGSDVGQQRMTGPFIAAAADVAG